MGMALHELFHRSGEQCPPEQGRSRGTIHPVQILILVDFGHLHPVPELPELLPPVFPLPGFPFFVESQGLLPLFRGPVQPVQAVSGQRTLHPQLQHIEESPRHPGGRQRTQTGIQPLALHGGPLLPAPCQQKEQGRFFPIQRKSPGQGPPGLLRLVTEPEYQSRHAVTHPVFRSPDDPFPGPGEPHFVRHQPLGQVPQHPDVIFPHFFAPAGRVPLTHALLRSLPFVTFSIVQQMGAPHNA
jgi:hypothetical protein